MRINTMTQAEAMRYAKIQRQIDLLCREDKSILDDMAEDALIAPFPVGSRIIVQGEKIVIKSKVYDFSDIQKVTINTEGSLSIYALNGRKLCSSIYLNAATKNIELFCLWVRKYNVPVEVISGKRERIFQWFIFAVVVLTIILLRLIRVLENLRHLFKI